LFDEDLNPILRTSISANNVSKTFFKEIHEQTRSIALIGMPGAGKSTIGKLLAKSLGWEFVDTDDRIKLQAGLCLQDILNQSGYLYLRELEEKLLSKMQIRSRTVVATGGSIVYSQNAMRHISKATIIVYMRVPVPILLNRIDNLDNRGIASQPNQTFEDLYTERNLLYQKYSDLCIDCGKSGVEKTVAEISTQLCDYFRTDRSDETR
jgi:shikimate kinase